MGDVMKHQEDPNKIEGEDTPDNPASTETQEPTESSKVALDLSEANAEAAATSAEFTRYKNDTSIPLEQKNAFYISAAETWINLAETQKKADRISPPKSMTVNDLLARERIATNISNRAIEIIGGLQSDKQADNSDLIAKLKESRSSFSEESNELYPKLEELGEMVGTFDDGVETYKMSDQTLKEELDRLEKRAANVTKAMSRSGLDLSYEENQAASREQNERSNKISVYSKALLNRNRPWKEVLLDREDAKKIQEIKRSIS